MKFRVALAGTLRLGALGIVIAERTEAIATDSIPRPMRAPTLAWARELTSKAPGNGGVI
jgi:hypothetical protein